MSPLFKNSLVHLGGCTCYEEELINGKGVTELGDGGGAQA